MRSPGDKKPDLLAAARLREKVADLQRAVRFMGHRRYSAGLLPTMQTHKFHLHLPSLAGRQFTEMFDFYVEYCGRFVFSGARWGGEEWLLDQLNAVVREELHLLNQTRTAHVPPPLSRWPVSGRWL